MELLIESTKPRLHSPSSTGLPRSRAVVPTQAVVWNGAVFVSGQTGVDRDGRVVSAGIRAQARQAIENVRHALRASGSDLDRVLKVTWFLTDVSDRPAVAEVRREFWADGLPASTLVEVSRLASPDLRIEVEAIAACDAP